MMEHAKRMQERDRADKLGYDDTSEEDQKSVNEVSFFSVCTKEAWLNTMLQAIVGIL